MSKKVSVIVPIYKAAPHLTKYLNSIVYQTCKNLEIILVNDGSTDNSAEIINQDYAVMSVIDFFYRYADGWAIAISSRLYQKKSCCFLCQKIQERSCRRLG